MGEECVPRLTVVRRKQQKAPADLPPQAGTLRILQGSARGFCALAAASRPLRRGAAGLAALAALGGLSVSCEDPTLPPRRGDCIGNPELVADCPISERRLVFFVGTECNPIPWPNSTVFVYCQGLAYPRN